jgi:hypothetical protein
MVLGCSSWRSVSTGDVRRIGAVHDHSKDRPGSGRADDLPVAFRAEAWVRPSRWRRRPERVFRYDARWADGRVANDVDLVALMYRRAPADYDVVKRSMLEHCPIVGVGAWIDYPTGSVLTSPRQQ